MNKIRIGRIASEIKKEISQMISMELNDSRIAPITSITEVDLKDDLQYAKIFVTVMGTDWEKKETISGLENSIGFIKRELGKRMNLRHIPELTFVLDEHMENAMKMDRLITEVIKKDEETKNEREED